MSEEPKSDPGSYRDPSSRIFNQGGRVLRALRDDAAEFHESLAKLDFFKRWQEEKRMIKTTAASEKQAAELKKNGWSQVVEHEKLPLVTYPYEWCFSMLREAALLHLQLQEEAMLEGWTFKDASAYNIQFFGVSPVFIDTGSLEPAVDGEPWNGYRQFCMTFLYPLLLSAYLDIEPAVTLRSSLDGIEPMHAAAQLRGLNRFRRGVLSHVMLPALIEAKMRKSGGRRSNPRKQSQTVRLGLVRGLKNLVDGLKPADKKTIWRDYSTEHSYSDADLASKLEFVVSAAAKKPRRQILDLGCNTGTFSIGCAPHSDLVIATDSDHGAIERLFRSLRQDGQPDNIVPLQIDLVNPSPPQGWASRERSSFIDRIKPDLVLALALIHHLSISRSVPLPMILDQLRELKSEVILEFVEKEDEMAVTLLQAKKESYQDYNLAVFEAEANARFRTVSRIELKGGKRKLYHLEPRG